MHGSATAPAKPRCDAHRGRSANSLYAPPACTAEMQANDHGAGEGESAPPPEEKRVKCPYCQRPSKRLSPIIQMFAAQRTYTEKGLPMHIARIHRDEVLKDSTPDGPPTAPTSRRKNHCRDCGKLVEPEIFQKGRYLMARCPRCGREWISKRWPEVHGR